MNKLLQAGKICNTHGVKGFVKVIPWTDYPEVFEGFSHIFVEEKKYDIEKVSYKKASVLLKLSGVDTVSDAEKLKDKTIYCTKEELGDLPQDTYFVADLLGCFVYNNDILIGKLKDIISTGSADVYEIEDESRKCIYLPAIKENILSIDITGKRIEVSIPEGLLE